MLQGPPFQRMTDLQRGWVPACTKPGVSKAPATGPGQTRAGRRQRVVRFWMQSGVVAYQLSNEVCCCRSVLLVQAFIGPCRR